MKRYYVEWKDSGFLWSNVNTLSVSYGTLAEAKKEYKKQIKKYNGEIQFRIVVKRKIIIMEHKVKEIK